MKKGRLLNLSLILAMAFPLLSMAQTPKRAKGPYTAVSEPQLIHIDPQYFGSVLHGGFGNNRGEYLKWPGVYYLSPKGAYAISLSKDEYDSVITLLNATIDSTYHGYSAVRHLGGYYYEMDHGRIKRRENYLRYINGDTIFVISGLPGKFLNFYRAVPDTIPYTISQLQEEVRKLCPGFIAGPKDAFTQSYHGYEYFLEYIDKKNMMRIRCTFVNEGKAEWVRDRWVGGKYYNLIEITKFIDPAVMPGPTFGRTGDISPYKDK
jgi:hypothetical protein